MSKSDFIIKNGVLAEYKGKDPEAVIPDGVREIGYGVFYDCIHIEKINIPESVTTIAAYAFKGCTGIKEISLPEKVTFIGIRAFEGCSSLREIIIPKGVDRIGERTFSGCLNLKSVVLPKKAVYIGKGAFAKCPNLKEANIPEGIDKIEDDAFWGCSSLEAVSIPERVSAIGKDAFGGCASLGMIAGGDRFDINHFRETKYFSDYLDQSRLMFGENAGSSSPRTHITDGVYRVPEGVSAIGIFGFLGVSGVREIVIPKSAEAIYEFAFSFCRDLTSITADAENPHFVSAGGALFSRDMTRLIAYPAGKNENSYKIPEGVISIEDGAFAGCVSLREIVIPDSVSSIGKGVFVDCGNLEEITGAERFPKECFNGTKWYEMK